MREFDCAHRHRARLRSDRVGACGWLRDLHEGLLGLVELLGDVAVRADRRRGARHRAPVGTRDLDARRTALATELERRLWHAARDHHRARRGGARLAHRARRLRELEGADVAAQGRVAVTPLVGDAEIGNRVQGRRRLREGDAAADPLARDHRLAAARDRADMGLGAAGGAEADRVGDREPAVDVTAEAGDLLPHAWRREAEVAVEAEEAVGPIGDLGGGEGNDDHGQIAAGGDRRRLAGREVEGHVAVQRRGPVARVLAAADDHDVTDELARVGRVDVVDAEALEADQRLRRRADHRRGDDRQHRRERLVVVDVVEAAVLEAEADRERAAVGGRQRK